MDSHLDQILKFEIELPEIFDYKYTKCLDQNWKQKMSESYGIMLKLYDTLILMF